MRNFVIERESFLLHHIASCLINIIFPHIHAIDEHFGELSGYLTNRDTCLEIVTRGTYR